MLVLGLGSGLLTLPSESHFQQIGPRTLPSMQNSLHPEAKVVGTDISPIQPSWSVSFPFKIVYYKSHATYLGYHQIQRLRLMIWNLNGHTQKTTLIIFICAPSQVHFQTGMLYSPRHSGGVPRISHAYSRPFFFDAVGV